MRLAVIGGSGVIESGLLENTRKTIVHTIFGSAEVHIGKVDGQEIAFLARHGVGHTVPPHKIDFRTNIAALKVLGVERIIATAAVGSMNNLMPPGSFVVPDQFIDHTWGRPVQFFEEGEWAVTHLDMTAPYCPQMRQIIAANCEAAGVKYQDAGCYVCFQGPRYETPAEIRMFSEIGGDIVGMTHVPEIVLAREAEICYGGICVVTNWAAGISKKPLSHDEITETMELVNKKLLKVISETISTMPEKRTCRCGSALDDMVFWGRRRPDFSAE